MATKNLVGQRFEKLTVTAFSHTGTHGKEYVCTCECGSKKVYRGSTLTSGRLIGCGCSIGKSNIGRTRSLNSIKNVGSQFNRLTIVDIERRSDGRGYLMVCKCSCGGATKTIFSDLVKGKVRSCGCYQREIASINGTNFGLNNGTKATKRFGWKYKGVAMRSGYEVMFAEVLERKGLEFSYEPKCFTLENNLRYTPDFYVPSERKYYEVKGQLTDTAMNKITMLRGMGVAVELVFIDSIEKELSCSYAKFKKQWVNSHLGR